MKLIRENLKKTTIGSSQIYEYSCEGSDFLLTVDGMKGYRRYIVFKKGVDDSSKEFTSSLDAWQYFEELVAECGGAQGSSGGFNRNAPQENPNIMPLLAIKKSASGGWDVTFFAVANNQQVSVMEFRLENDNSFESPTPNGVFEKDWEAEEIPNLFKCVVMFLKQDIVFEDDKDADVFLFVPTSLMSQGGTPTETTGQEPPINMPQPEGYGQQQPKGDGEPQPKGDGEPQPKGDGEPQPKGDGEPQPKGDGEPQPDGDGQPQPNGQGQPKGEGEPDDEGQPQYGVMKGGQQESPQPPPTDLLRIVSEHTNVRVPILKQVFRDEEVGANFLLENNFRGLKAKLNLDPKTTAQQLAQTITNSF